MILRRIKVHVEKENWFAVGIDFCIVVIGVFIGIQVANWNDVRADVQQEQEIIDNIKDDIRSDIKDLSNAIQMADINIRAANYTLVQTGFEPVTSFRLATGGVNISRDLTTMPVPDTLPPEQTIRLWSDIVVRYHGVQSDTAFNTLLATGRLSLIRDRQLVRQLQTYRQSWADLKGSQDTTFKPVRDQTVFVGQKSGLSPFITLPEEEFFTLVREDQELRGALRTMLEYSILHREVLESTLTQAEELMAELEDVAP